MRVNNKVKKNANSILKVYEMCLYGMYEALNV